MIARDAALAAAQVVVVAAVLVGTVGIVRALPALGHGDTATLTGALSLALELFLAAGLLRLGARPEPSVVALAFGLLLVRKTLAAGLRLGARAVMAFMVRPAR